MKSVLVDTGFLVAVYNKSDLYHAACMDAYSSLNRALATCEPVLAETLHLLRHTSGAADDILASIEAGVLEIPFDLSQSAAQVRRILNKYRDTPADLADSCLIVMADELETGDILTLDSDFAHYRWRRNRTFHMLIPLE